MPLELYRDYTREEAHDLLAPEAPFYPGGAQWGLHGIIALPKPSSDFVFFVSYGRSIADHDFDEGISADGVLSWQSQPSQTLDTARIRELIGHDERNANIYLFLRTSTRSTQPYTYLGRLKYLRHDKDREKPVYFHWQILDWNPPGAMLDRMGLVLDGSTEAASVTPPAVTRSGRTVEPPPKSDPDLGRGVGTDSFRAHRSPDWGAREAANRELGLAGEQFVVDLEMRALEAMGRPDLAAQVRHIAVDVGDGAGYDVLSYDADGESKFIEVKTTKGGAETDFFASENERRFAEKVGEAYHLYRVHDFDANLGVGDVYVLRGPLADNFTLRPTQYRVQR